MDKKKLKDKVIKRDGCVCAKCGSKGILTLDHIIPKSLGGANSHFNLQLLCFPCNSAKGNTIKLHTKDKEVYRYIKNRLKVIPNVKMIHYLGERWI